MIITGHPGHLLLPQTNEQQAFPHKESTPQSQRALILDNQVCKDVHIIRIQTHMPKISTTRLQLHRCVQHLMQVYGEYNTSPMPSNVRNLPKRCNVEHYGIYISVISLPFLGTTPDGTIYGKDGYIDIAEVKHPFKYRGTSIEETVKTNHSVWRKRMEEYI